MLLLVLCGMTDDPDKLLNAALAAVHLISRRALVLPLRREEKVHPAVGCATAAARGVEQHCLHICKLWCSCVGSQEVCLQVDRHMSLGQPVDCNHDRSHVASATNMISP